MTKRYFITGTDTNVGKTIASVALLHSAKKNGYITAGYKPVASGGRLFSERLCNNDALLLQKNSSSFLSYQEVNPYVFAKATLPNIISHEECRPIDFYVLSNGLRILERKANWVLVEGAGGWFTPLSANQTFADWVKLEKLSVILIIGVKLGCVNHAILTAQAIVQSGLRLVGWITNNITPLDKKYHEYIITLKNFLSSTAPLLGEIPWIEKVENYVNISNYLNFHILCPHFSNNTDT